MCICSSFNKLASPSKIFRTFCYHFSYYSILPKNPWQLFNPTIFFPLVLMGILFSITNVWAWEVNTHRELTEQAINMKEAELNAYLINNLDLEGGLNASVKGGSPRELMIQGSDNEDNPPRFLRHFHEPISNGGLLSGTLESSINWSLRPKGDQEWSWNDAREYYFKALTSENKTDRDIYWGKTFRALGQVMHLLQDSANPSHVRDDPHPFDDGLHDYLEKRSVGSYIGGGIFSPDPSMLEQSGATRSEPFSNLFDRDIYLGGNPEGTLGNDVGIAEYTNANFFTDDTIPGQASFVSTEIPYPKVTELVPAPVPSLYMTLPRLGSPAFPGARAAKLTGNQAVATFLLTNTNFDLLGQLQLDDAVYDAYSSHLIPRAVGYSAAVLDYFFRGGVEVTSNEFVVTATNQEGGCAPIPSEEFGNLDVRFEIPSDLNFVGTVSLYYERSNGTRVLGEQGITLQPGQTFWLGAIVLHSEIPNPVRWHVVLEGQAGPGAQEPRAVIAKSDVAEWFFGCLG